MRPCGVFHRAFLYGPGRCMSCLAEKNCEMEVVIMGRKTKSDEYIVYRHTNSKNKKVYIGITSTTIEKRSGKDGNGYKKNKYFYAAIQKYGWSSFSHEVLYSGLKLDDAARIERQTISEYKSNNPTYGYNLSSGGEGGNTGVKLGDEARLRKSLAMSGARNPCYGKVGKLHLHTVGRKLRLN